MPTNNNINELLPNIALKVNLALHDLDSHGVWYFISETYRSQEVQDAYYAQGRKSLDVVNVLRLKAGLRVIGVVENSKIITNTKISKHTSRKAIDIYPCKVAGQPLWSAKKEDFQPIANAFKRQGFDWGGDWNKPDSSGNVFTDFPNMEYNGGL